MCQPTDRFDCVNKHTRMHELTGASWTRASSSKSSALTSSHKGVHTMHTKKLYFKHSPSYTYVHSRLCAIALMLKCWHISLQVLVDLLRDCSLLLRRLSSAWHYTALCTSSKANTDIIKQFVLSSCTQTLHSALELMPPPTQTAVAESALPITSRLPVDSSTASFDTAAMLDATEIALSLTDAGTAAVNAKADACRARMDSFGSATASTAAADADASTAAAAVGANTSVAASSSSAGTNGVPGNDSGSSDSSGTEKLKKWCLMELKVHDALGEACAQASQWEAATTSCNRYLTITIKLYVYFHNAVVYSLCALQALRTVLSCEYIGQCRVWN
jgi:hypothetical protein